MDVTVDDLRLRLSGKRGHPALFTPDGGVVDYAELLERADALRERLGPAPRLVFLETSNSIDAIAAYLGCLLGGHPVYPFANQDALMLSDLVARYRPDVIVRPSAADPIAWHAGGAPRVFHPDLSLLLSTSGSTGSPKFVKLSRGNLLSNADSICEYLQIASRDRAITSLPFHYSYGLSVVHSHLFAGASLLLNDAPITDPAFFQTLAAGEATSFAGVPYTFEVLRIADPGWAEIPSLRHVTQAGGRLAPHDVAHFAELGALHDWRFYVMYGQTECAPRIAYLPPEKATAFPDCIGVAIHGGRITLIDEQGDTIVAPDVEGELVYTGPNVMLGYAEAAADLATGSLPAPHRTGDIARRNADGLFTVVGRISRFIKPYGLRVNLDELQAELRTLHPDLTCTGSDEQIVIATLGADDLKDASLLDRAVQRLKLPPSLFTIVHPREMPLLDTGKIDYPAILALAAQDRAAPRGAARLATILSFRFVRQVFVEASQILGLSDPQWEGVRHIYAKLLNLPSVDGAATFVMLAGDSLSYVQTSIALEQYLGHLPSGWESWTVDELEQEGAVEQAF